MRQWVSHSLVLALAILAVVPLFACGDSEIPNNTPTQEREEKVVFPTATLPPSETTTVEEREEKTISPTAMATSSPGRATTAEEREEKIEYCFELLFEMDGAFRAAIADWEATRAQELRDAGEDASPSAAEWEHRVWYYTQQGRSGKEPGQFAYPDPTKQPGTGQHKGAPESYPDTAKFHKAQELAQQAYQCKIEYRQMLDEAGCVDGDYRRCPTNQPTHEQ